jgi:hypothetical protein
MWMGVTALAATAASVYYYYYVANESSTTSSKKKKWLDNDDTTKKDPQDHSDDITVKSKGRSFDGGGGTDQHRTAGTASSAKTIRTDDNDDEPSSILQMDETTLHARIEELDKKGKAYFKNKQVRGRPFVVCAGNCHHRPLVVHVIETTIFCRLMSLVVLIFSRCHSMDCCTDCVLPRCVRRFPMVF